MSNLKHQTFDLIRQLTGQDHVLTLNVTFIDFLGDLECGLFLSQLIYWSDRASREDGFIYKTDQEWYEELRLSKYAVRKSKKKLETLGIIETKVKKANGNPTTHYKINKDSFVEMFISFLRNQQNESLESKVGTDEIELSLTEITTEKEEEEKAQAPNENPFNFYEQNGFGLIGSHISQKISMWCDDLSDDLVLEAMKQAVENGSKTWRYTESILRDWADKKLTTVEQVQAEQKSYREKLTKQRERPRAKPKGTNFTDLV